MITQQRPTERSKRERINSRFAVDDHDETVKGFVYPIWSPAEMAREGRVAILHSTTDGVKGEYFGSGQKAGLTRRALGLDPKLVSEVGVVWHKIIGSPPKSLVLQYRDLTMQALDAADVDFVLLHGAAAMNLWRSDLTLGQVRGKLGLWNRRWWVCAVPQVDGVLSHRGEVTMAEWESMVRRFGELAGEWDAFKYIGQSCIAKVGNGLCGVSATKWDDDALGWCERHWEKGQARKGEVARKVEREANKMNQVGLFDDEGGAG